jgi:hypothetical protein
MIQVDLRLQIKLVPLFRSKEYQISVAKTDEACVTPDQPYFEALANCWFGKKNYEFTKI